MRNATDVPLIKAVSLVRRGAITNNVYYTLISRRLSNPFIIHGATAIIKHDQQTAETFNLEIIQTKNQNYAYNAQDEGISEHAQRGNNTPLALPVCSGCTLAVNLNYAEAVYNEDMYIAVGFQAPDTLALAMTFIFHIESLNP